jgi:hypothetical protein
MVHLAVTRERMVHLAVTMERNHEDQVRRIILVQK